MKSLIDKPLLAASAIVGALLFALLSVPGMAGPSGQKDIVETAVSAGSFKTLVTALEEADLVSTLKGEGPFTVFAPTDEAFAKLPPEQLQALLRDKEALRNVLTYHVVAGRMTSDRIADWELNQAETVQGQSIRIRTGAGVQIDDARVVKADILASNGVIHVIDRVILPN